VHCVYDGVVVVLSCMYDKNTCFQSYLTLVIIASVVCSICMTWMRVSCDTALAKKLIVMLYWI
jgi:hypothetical protein